MGPNDLRVNKHLLKRGGVIGRLDYVKNMMIIFVTAIALFIGLGYVPAKSDFAFYSLSGIMLILVAGLSYLSYINSFKRLRDIRGTTHQQLLFQIGLAVLISIPYVALVPAAILAFAEGAVTGQGNAFGTLIDESAAPQPDMDSQKIDNLSRLYQLKETGAITKDEYKHYKDDVFKKSA